MEKKNSEKRQPHHQKLARWLDDRFTIPGTDIRFGLDPLISLIPGAGDWVAGLISGYFILLGARSDVPPAVLGRMGFNIILDVVIGSVPLLGDLFDVAWKANIKNAELLEEYSIDAETTERHSKAVLWTVAVVLLLIIIGLLYLIGWLLVTLITAIF